MRPSGWEPAPPANGPTHAGTPPPAPAVEPPAAPRGAPLTAAARYEDFLRSAVDWLWETDATLALSYVSSPVALNLGIPSQVLIGRPLLGLGRFEPGGTADQRGREALDQRRPFRGAIFIMRDAGEREVRYRLSGVPYFEDRTGHFAGFRGTGIAVAPGSGQADPPSEEELRALMATLEEALLRAQDLAWRQSQAVPQAAPHVPAAPADDTAPAAGLLRRTAHELRTPLNAIVGYADIGLGQLFGTLGERYLDCFRTIREAGRHLNDVVAQMQRAGNIPGALALEARQVDIASIVAKAKAMIALAAKASEIDISRVGPMAGGRAIGDEPACTQILVNLLSNAVKYTHAGGSIGLETLVGPDGKLQIVVWDTGIGIDPDEHERIFETDYRSAQVKASGGPEGSGLGLAISRDLARAMGGDLRVSSVPGQGTRFILSLPHARPAGEPAA